MEESGVEKGDQGENGNKSIGRSQSSLVLLSNTALGVAKGAGGGGGGGGAASAEEHEESLSADSGDTN